MTTEEAKLVLRSWGVPKGREYEAIMTLIPELGEARDERIREELIEFIQWSEDRGMTRHDFHQAKRPAEWIAWLKKQKEEPVEHWQYVGGVNLEEDKEEQKPVEPSDEELQRHHDELYDFKVFAARQAKEHHISFVHDFEWNNFCEELLSYFNENQKPVEIKIDNPNIQKIEPDVKVTTSDSSADGKELLYVSNKSYKIGYRDGVNSVKKPAEWSEEDEKQIRQIERIVESSGCSKQLQEKIHNWFKSLSPQPKQEWSKEDEEMLEYIIGDVNDATQLYTTRAGKDMANKEIAWLKSLRPHWKPSEEQMTALNYAIAEWDGGKKLEGLYALRNDLKKLM